MLKIYSTPESKGSEPDSSRWSARPMRTVHRDARFGVPTQEGEPSTQAPAARGADFDFSKVRILAAGRETAEARIDRDHGHGRARAGVAPVLEHAPVAPQGKLTAGAPGDRYEQEADGVAEQVMGGGASGAEHHSAHVLQPRLQRMSAGCAAADKKLREKPIAPSPRVSGGALAVNAVRGGGAPLPAAARSFFEMQLGRDLGGVRVHTDAAAAASAEALSARAYTFGQHIVFGPGNFQPHSAEGRRLLAHELVHTIQQSGTAAGMPRVQRAPKGLSPDDVRKQLLAIGDAGVNEIVNALPASLWGVSPQPKVVKTATVNGAKHEFDYSITMKLGGISPLSSVSGATEELAPQAVGAGKTAATRHRIRTTIPQTMPQFVETLFHELVHARLLIDKELPEADKSMTGRRYAMVQEATGMTGLATLTGLAPKRDAVRDALAKLRGFFGALDPKVASGFTQRQSIDSLYEFVVNEKFTNTESATAFKHPLPNQKIAERYSMAVRNDFQILVQDLGLFQLFSSKVTNGPLDTVLAKLVDGLTAALKALFDAIDGQMATISGIAAAKPVKGPLPQLSPIPPQPVRLVP